VERRFRAHSLIRLALESGRTHQIRVHMAYIDHPLVGDTVYGGRLRVPAGAGTELTERLRAFKRQALHAEQLNLRHPLTEEAMHWRSPLPPDMQELLAALEEDEKRRP
jgi:23S rRNA pseudouridine1911/1915/1917 synthase